MIFPTVKPVIQLNADVVSDDDLYSDVDQDGSINIPMDTSAEKDDDPEFEVPMTPVPSKRRKSASETITQSTQNDEQPLDSPVSTPARGFTRKRKPVFEPELNMRPKQGYTSYPAHLFDVPPAALNVEHLRKKFLIEGIAKSRASKLCHERAITFMNFVTEAVRKIAEENGYKLTPTKKNRDTSDHEYCMSQASVSINENDKSTHNEGTSNEQIKSKL